MATGAAPPLRKLTRAEERVILHGGTEPPFSGEYEHHRGVGVYACKQCGTPLYRSSDKFDAGCGWPSFDQEIPGTVRHLPDRDGERVESDANVAVGISVTCSLVSISPPGTPAIA